MAGDVNSNIFINVDTSSAMAQLRALEKELTALNRALVIGTKTAAQAQSKYAQGLLHNVNATGQWTASMTRMSTASEQFANNLDRSRLSLKEYFRYGMASTKTFGRVFGNEFDTVSKLVQKRVKTLQQQYVQLGRDAQGAMNALKFTPKALNYRDVTTQLMMATQRQQIFNKLLDDGSTKLLNFGKNTQWAGRQLMVGFTVPLMLFGAQAIRVFKEIETQTIRFKKVYGDIFTDPGQTDLALKNIRALADEYTKYGVKVADTIKMAADAAAAGNSGKDLEQIVEQTNRLAVLGGVTQEKALETTIALKNAFEIGASDLDQTINFLNAVENQTVVALEDLTEAIPRVAPVVQQLGGDVKDLAFFMAAMQEGGISAAQGANALKSGLGSLINPSNKAAEAAAKVGVNIKGIVEANQGNLRNIVVGFAQALEPLTDLQRTRVIEDVFGKYQFARISALLNNVTKEGTQAARVLQLANASVEELGILAERELGVQADSSMNKFVGAVERLKAAIAPVGEVFAKTLTPVIEFITKMAERFNKLPEGIKKGIATIVAVVGGLGPIFLMTFGLMANAMANAMKGFNLLRKGYQQLAYGSSDAALKTQYLSQEELENISVTNALYSTHERLSAAYKIESTALGALIAQYGTATNAMRNFSMANPGLFVPGKVVPPIRRAGGGKVSGPGTATSDSIPAYLSDGEYVINAKAVDTYGVGTFDALNARKYASGGPVIGKDGVPRLSIGGWMTRILNSMLPRTRMGVVQEGVSGYALSGFGGGSRATASATGEYYPNSPAAKQWRKIPWQEDERGLIIKDPDTNEEYLIRKGNRAEFDKAFDDLVSRGGVQKRGERPAMSSGEYLLHRLHKYKKVKESELTPTNVLGQAGAKGAARVRTTGASQGGAYRRWGDAVKSRSPRVMSLIREFDSEEEYLRKNFPELHAKLSDPAYNRFVISPSHISPAGANRDASSWGRELILRDSSLINMAMKDMTKGKRMPKSTRHPKTQAEAQQIINAIQNLGSVDQLAPTVRGALEILKLRVKNNFYGRHDISDVGLGLKGGGLLKLAGGTVFVGMPKSFAKVQKTRALAKTLDEGVRASRFRNLPVTDTGVKIKSLGGYSVGEISKSVNGIYRHPNGRVVVYKAVESEEAALAEMRMSALMRSGSELNTPRNQSIKVIADPTDLARQRKILAIESDYDPRFENPKGEFNEKQFIKQTLASGIRGDKDVKRSNLSENDVIDQGNSGVFSTASSRFKYADSMKSVEEQLLINFGAVKGSGASKDFSKAVRKMAKQMGYPAFKRAMLKEIEESVPRYKATIDTFKLTPKERKIYDDLVLRLEKSKDADWKKIYDAAAGIPGYENGVFSVPGPKGAGDVVPAMLSPGEAVIPTAESEKYRPLIRSIIADKVPGFITGRTGGIDDPWDTPSNVPKSRGDILADKISGKVADATTRSGVLGGIARRITSAVDRAANSGPTPMTSMERNAAARAVPPSVAQPFMALNNTIAANTAAVDDDTDATKNNAKTAKQIADEEKKLRKTQGIGGLLRGYGKVPDFDEQGNRLTYQQKQNARQLERMNRAQKMMGPSMGIAMAGSMAGMYAMSNPDKQFMGANLGQLAGPLMGISVLAGLLPMLNSPIKMLIAGAIGLAAVFKMQSSQIKQSIIDGQNQGRSMVMTTNQLEEFGKITNKVSLTQEAEARRRARTTEIVPVSMDFGKNFIQNSDYGKQFKTNFDTMLGTPGLGPTAAAESLANQLSTAVTQGVLTATQAESIAVALTRNLKDAKLEMDVRGRLIQLIGPNGDNILENPVQVQLNLIASNKQIQEAAFSNLQSIINKERSGFLGVSGKEGLQLAGGAVAGAGAGLYGASKAKAAMETAKTGSKVKTALNATRVLRLGSMATAGSVAGVIPGVIGTAIFGGIEIALRQWQKGNEKKAIGKAAGLFAGVASENLKASQQSIDAINFELNNAIANLEVKKKLAKTSEEKAAIDQRITELESKRDSGLSKVRAAQGDMLKSVTTQYSQVSKGAFTEILPGGSGRGQVRDKFMEAFSTGLKEKFKGNAGQLSELSALQSTLDKLENDEITLQISTLIDSDVLTPREAGLVVANLSKDKKLAQKELEAIVKVHGTEGLQRLGTIMDFIPKAKNRKDLQLLIQSSNKTDADEVMSAIEELIKLPSYLGFNINIETQKRDQERLEKVGEEIADLKKMIPDGKLSIKLLQDLQQKAGGPGKNLTLDAAIAQWDTLSKLPKELQFSAMITIGSISQSDSFDKILDRELEAAFKKANPTFAMPTNQMPSTLSTQYAAQFAKFKADQKNIDAATKAYFAKTLPELYGTKTPSTIKTPTGGTTGDKGKGPDTSWLSDLLQRLKLLKEGSIDATGSFKELLNQVTKFFGPGLMSSVNPSLDKTRGALLQIEDAAKAAGITLSTEFVDFIEGLDADQFEEFRDQFLLMSKGNIVGFKGTSNQFFGSDAAYDRRQKAIKDGTFDGSQQSIFGQVNEAFKTRTMAEFIKKQQDSIKDTNLQVEAFKKLTDATGEFKFDAMAAMEVLKDPNLAKDIALGNKIFSPADRKSLLTSINQTYEAASKLSKIKMIQDTQSLQNQVKAFEKLTAEGYDYTTILKVIENEAYAYEIANDQVDGLSEATKALVKDTENYINALNTLESTKFFQERTNALQLKKDFAAIVPLLLQAGATMSDINEILSNPTLAKAFIQELKDGSLDAGKIKDYLDQIPEYKQVDIELKIGSTEGQEEEFERLFSKAMEYYDLLEGKIEDDFEPLLKSAQDKIDATQEKIEGINEEIEDFQDNIDTKQRKIELEITRPIDVLQKESSDLGNDLDLMNRSADEITKRYDEQAKALTKVSEINSRIANQQKQQLSLADALSQGDISAAALAAQEIRATSAEAMQEDQLGILGAAKERDIANLRSKGGLTRLQIENRQFAISQEIYALEQKREVELLAIRDIEDKIYDIKVGRLKLAQDELDLANKALKDYQKQRDAAIEAVDRQREVWRDAKLAIGFARIDAGYYNDVIEFSNTLVTLMKDGWLGVGNAILAAVAALALYNAALTKKPLTFEQAQAQAQNTLTGYLDVFGTKLGSADQQIIALETKIAEAMDRGEDTSALEAELEALRASTETLADNMYDVAGALDKVDNATTISGINAAVSQGTSVIKNPYGDIDIEWEPIWVPGDGEGGAGGDFVQVASKGGIIKPKYLRKGGLTNPLYRPMGGLIPYFLGGGFAKGTDTVPAMLTPGEFVMSRYAVNAHGIDRMKAINSGDSIGESVYNYSINVNVKSDANPDEIARAVMTHIKQVDSKRLRGAQI